MVHEAASVEKSESDAMHKSLGWACASPSSEKPRSDAMCDSSARSAPPHSATAEMLSRLRVRISSAVGSIRQCTLPISQPEPSGSEHKLPFQKVRDLATFC